MTSYQSTQRYRSTDPKSPRESSAGLMVLALFLGIAVAILGMLPSESVGRPRR